MVALVRSIFLFIQTLAEAAKRYNLTEEEQQLHLKAVNGVLLELSHVKLCIISWEQQLVLGMPRHLSMQ